MVFGGGGGLVAMLCSVYVVWRSEYVRYEV